MEYRVRHIKQSVESLKSALEVLHQHLEELESALLDFEGALGGQERQEHPRTQQGGLDLLSIEDVCQELGMGKSWTYRRIKSGEIPSVQLGGSVKVKREDLEEYIQNHRRR